MKIKVKKRMEEEELSVTELVAITGLSRRTVNRFLHNEGNVSDRTIKAMQSFLDFEGKYKDTVQLINIGQVRIPKEHYDYLKRRADEDDVAVLEVVRYVIEQVVENDYLWKAFSEHINITELAVRNVIQKILIPFIKTQDKALFSIETQAYWLEEMLLRSGFYSNPNDEELKEAMSIRKEALIEEIAKRVYKRNRD